MADITITPEQQKAYLESPNTCPFCGNENITANRPEIANNDECWVDVYCLNCCTHWTEHFTMAEIGEAYNVKAEQ